MVQLVAKVKMSINHKPVRPGDVFDVKVHHARILTLLRKADVYVPPVTISKPAVELSVAEDEPQDAPAKRAYKRRDMTAEE
jgi:hypothetical protein